MRILSAIFYIIPALPIFIIKKDIMYILQNVDFLKLVAGARFELTTSGLWARRATRLLYPAVL